MLRVNTFYKIANYLYRIRIPLLPKLITYFIRLVFSAYVPHTAKIGKNVVFGYGALGVVIHGKSTIGNNCLISQNVTLGGTSKREGAPTLGNNVFLATGAKVLGPVNIGDNVVVGANAVVVNDIPANSLAVGIPAKVIKSNITMSDYV